MVFAPSRSLLFLSLPFGHISANQTIYWSITQVYSTVTLRASAHVITQCHIPGPITRLHPNSRHLKDIKFSAKPTSMNDKFGTFGRRLLAHSR